MHLCFYLTTACFLVLPRMCKTTKKHFRIYWAPGLEMARPAIYGGQSAHDACRSTAFPWNS